MRYSDQSYNLRIELDTKNCTCSAEEIERMEETLDALDRVTQQFPVSNLYITIHHHARSNDYHVKTSLALPGRTLFTGERHEDRYTAYERCIGKLVQKVAAYKSHLDDEDERTKFQKGTHQEIIPTQVPDHAVLVKSVADDDYVTFRKETWIYEEPVRKRIGRWIKRYPELQQLIGVELDIADFVEDVFLTAFHQFHRKPDAVLPGDWLEGLIDEVMHNLMAHPDRELDKIEEARAAIEAESDLDFTED